MERGAARGTMEENFAVRRLLIAACDIERDRDAIFRSSNVSAPHPPPPQIVQRSEMKMASTIHVKLDTSGAKLYVSFWL